MTRLVVLGLLCWRPMTGYEIQQYLQLSQTDRWADILPGSIYHALKKMTVEGLVAVQRIEQTGHRSKAIFAVTEAGRQEFHRLAQEALRTPVRTFPTSLYLVLGFVDDLPREEVMAAVAEHIIGLEAELAFWNDGEAAKVRAMGGALPPTIQAMFANGREHLEADLRFLRRLQAILPEQPPMERAVLDMEEEEP